MNTAGAEPALRDLEAVPIRVVGIGLAHEDEKLAHWSGPPVAHHCGR
jgi:hypothetical protein